MQSRLLLRKSVPQSYTRIPNPVKCQARAFRKSSARRDLQDVSTIYEDSTPSIRGRVEAAVISDGLSARRASTGSSAVVTRGHLRDGTLATSTKDDGGKPPEGPEELPDAEWEIKTGRAIYILQQTLPEFFQTGLVATLDRGVLDVNNHPPSSNGLISATFLHTTYGKSMATLYAPNIRLSYHPPVTLPVPGMNGKMMQIEGLPLYVSSSVFVRTTMKALYNDLEVTLKRMRVTNGPEPDVSGTEQTPPAPDGDRQLIKKHPREKSVFISLGVTGTARVSGARSEWEVNSTYEFSPYTGLIQSHVVNSIQPAPHHKVYDALRSALEGLGFGLRGGQGAGGT
ncbi:hypothetical protein PUNSTDRAFT_55396 [Punctularia strigosozonata HHB-11173 SS5]|uniref:Uncharacterized protein n=1 Tax=Punctularia strigosozonata (strain HHB-11173) TaxID=741275 RepID=R7S5I2_PUNST|nr:uncharacterized protein PUNSTDRAFT_55396 [Punctularia strigosozonata HHB-11173 SS5]EIN04671.1 hypothetical protein PUNSTDRAFT_55396 [Punctularia strigosozonata HHB-11173 SS5]